MFKLSLIFPEKELVAGLHVLSGKLQDMRKPFNEIIPDYTAAIREEFRKEGRPKWKQLQPSTMADRARKGYPPAHPILFRTGTLLNAFTLKQSKFHVRTITKRSLTIGASGSLHYPSAHQYGYPDNNLPARPPLNIKPSSIKRMLTRVQLWVLQEAADSFPGYAKVPNMRSY